MTSGLAVVENDYNHLYSNDDDDDNNMTKAISQLKGLIFSVRSHRFPPGFPVSSDHTNIYSLTAMPLCCFNFHRFDVTSKSI